MRRSRCFIVVAASTLAFFAWGCSGPKRDDKAVIGLVSPFEVSRVRLAEKSFGELADKGTPVLLPDVQLIAKIDNACAREWCDGASGSESITCPAYQADLNPRLQKTFQVYTIPNPGALSEEDLQAWISNSKIDTECIRGVSEIQTYQSSVFNDPSYGAQTTNLSLIEFEAGQASFPSTALATVKVGIIDSGVAADSDLVVASRSNFSVNSVARGSAFPLFENDDQTKPNNFHGTFVAAIVGAKRNNSDKIVGLAPNVELHAYAVGNGNGSMSNLEISNAISAAVLDGMEVVNMSFGTSGSKYNDDPMTRDGIVQGYIANLIFVAAAGNSGVSLATTKVYPAQYATDLNNVIAVAASDTFGQRAPFSNYGGPVNIVAPGSSIYSINPANLGGGVIPSNGTSFAAPMVTGAVALTIGIYKQKNIPISADQIRTAVAYTGANLRSDLTAVAQNGAFLNLRILGQSLQQAATQLPLTVSSSLGRDALGNPTLQLLVRWDSTKLPAFDPTERLGVFDLSPGCNFSLPCLLGSVSYANSGATCDAAGQCSLAMTISRSQLIAMMGSKSDPRSVLPVTVAFYHTVLDPVTGKPKNNYSVELSSSFDLRKINGNTGEAVFGQITNFRMDMSNLYVEGWACRPKSEEAVKIALLDSLGQPVTADYAYDYSLMVPHGSPIDGNYMWKRSIAQSPHMNPFYIKGSPLQKSRTSYLAGLEGHAGLVDKCGTFTTAHGFEFAVPLKAIVENGWVGKAFRIVADGTVNVADDGGRVWFEFPEPAPATLTQPSFTISRSPTQYQMTGSLCSSSQSPIIAEISYSNYNAVWALTGREPLLNSNSPFVTDSKLVASVSNPLPVETVQNKSATDMALAISVGSLAPDDPDPFVKAYLSFPANFRPNALVSAPSVMGSTAPSLIDSYTQNVNTYGFGQIGTGLQLTYTAKAMSVAAGTIHAAERAAVDRSRTSNGLLKPFDFNWNYWDYYDVGEPFSTNLVGYDLAKHYSTVYTNLKTTYQVTTLLRDAKKYETPLGFGNTALGLAPLGISGACANQEFKHDLPAWTLSTPAERFPYYVQAYQGFWLTGTAPNLFSVATLQQAADRLPLTVRFFQDGKMVMHLESQASSPSSFVQVPYEY